MTANEDDQAALDLEGAAVEGDNIDNGDVETTEPVVAEASPVASVMEDVEPEPEPPVVPPAPNVPVGDYAEIAALQKKILKRHGRNMFDTVSTRWWRRISEICDMYR